MIRLLLTALIKEKGGRGERERTQEQKVEQKDVKHVLLREQELS